jgi:hypothetical protein
MKVLEVWRQAHLKLRGSGAEAEPLGSRDGSRTRQRGGSGLTSPPREAPDAAPPPWRAPGGSYTSTGE